MKISDARLWPDRPLWLAMIGLGDDMKKASKAGLLRKGLSDEDFLRRLSKWSLKRSVRNRGFHQQTTWNWRGTTPEMRDDDYWYERAHLTPRRTQ